ncbi:MAG: GNAT family N-acetyltransferase [Phormidesmis sp.]
MSRRAFVPSGFTVPTGLVTEQFRLRMLSINDVVKDYEAVMTSYQHLHERSVFGPQSTWPAADLSFEQDLIDLGWHQKEFQNRTSFAYTLMNLDETRCLGCVYIDPAEPEDYDAQVVLWVRQSELATGLEEKLVQAVKTWLAEAWPFQRVGFPGRDSPWAKWGQSN